MLSTSLEATQRSPALMLYNDGVFTEKDFKSITSIGASGKASDSSTIGRFGLGFNSCYHFTDLPSFVSADSLCLFDPHRRHLPGGHAGARCALVAPEARARLRDQLRPFAEALPLFTVDPSSADGAAGNGEVLPPEEIEWPLQATLFRLPLRTEAQAAESEISSTAHSVAAMRESLQRLAKSAPEALLFLQSVRRIRVLRRPAADGGAHGGGAQLLCDASIANCDEELLAARGNLRHFVKHAAVQEDVKALTKTYQLAIEVLDATRSDGSPQRSSQQQWLLSAVAEAAPQELSEAAGAATARWATVAARLDHHQDHHDDDFADETAATLPRPPPVEGRLFCFLPLPAKSGLPVHVHGSFALNSAREPCASDSTADGGAARGLWNSELVAGPAATAYAQLVAAVARRLGASPRDVWAVWPCCALAAASPLTVALARAALLEITSKGRKVLCDGAGRWHALDGCLLQVYDEEEEEADAGASEEVAAPFLF